MKKPISFGSIGFELVSDLEDDRTVPAADDPFRICVLGDFSGRGSRGVVEGLEGRKSIAVDRDDIDEAVLKIKPRIALDVMGQHVEARFDSMDSFHPDELFNQVGLFQVLQETRNKLGDSRTYNAALKELRILMGLDEGQISPKEKPREKQATVGGSILDEIIGDTEEGTLSKGGSGRGDVEDLVEAIVRPHSLAAPDPDEDRIREVFDEYISLLMGEFLHHRTVQAMESAWRGLHFLASRAETGEDLEIRILDVSKEELAADLLADDDLTSSQAYRLFVKDPLSSPEGRPWAVLMGNYTFGPGDAEVLGRMARIAAAAGAPFIARAHPGLAGYASSARTPNPDDDDAWDALRGLPEAAYVGLAAPRFLLRLPYGKETDPVDAFDFEETSDAFAHEHYLWGNPAFACACLLAEAFSSDGWSMTPGQASDIDGLPLHTVEIDGEPAVKPCAEILPTEKALNGMIDRGIMPLATMRNTDVIRLVRFQSLASPAKRLGGRWQGGS